MGRIPTNNNLQYNNCWLAKREGKDMIRLSPKWISFLLNQPETGMGYSVCTIRLKDGREFKQVVVDGGFITKIKDVEGVPFSEDQIEEITVTHDKWRW